MRISGLHAPLGALESKLKAKLAEPMTAIEHFGGLLNSPTKSIRIMSDRGWLSKPLMRIWTALPTSIKFAEINKQEKAMLSSRLSFVILDSPIPPQRNALPPIIAMRLSCFTAMIISRGVKNAGHSYFFEFPPTGMKDIANAVLADKRVVYFLNTEIYEKNKSAPIIRLANKIIIDNTAKQSKN